MKYSKCVMSSRNLQLATICSTVLLTLLFSSRGFSQSSDDLQIPTQNENEIDQTLNKMDPAGQPLENEPLGRFKKSSTAEQQKISTLGLLVPYSDIAVIQKRYLPKTRRVELFPSLGLIVNQAFYSNYVLSGRVAYHFSEKLALEANGFWISTTQKDVTKDLNEIHGISTSNLINTKSFYGLDLRWTPIYGKMAFNNKSIVPFDMYFVGGGGVMQTTSVRDASPAAVHVGTGQIFALSQSMAARWDLGWYFYSAQNGSFNDMQATLGISFFVPKASYR